MKAAQSSNRWEIKPACPPRICVCQSHIHCPGLQHPLSSRSPHSVIIVETKKLPGEKKSLFFFILPRAWRKHFWKIKENQTTSSLEKINVSGFSLYTLKFLSEPKDVYTTTQSKGNQEIFQRSQKTFLINCQTNFPHWCSLNKHFKIYIGTNLKRFEIPSLNQIIYEKIYIILSNFKNIISGHEIREKPQNKYELKGTLTIM